MVDPLRLHADDFARGATHDLAVNVIAGGPPPWLRASIADAIDDVDRYPDEHAAVDAIARRHGRDPDEVVLVNGAAQAFWLLALALEPQRAACVHPSFAEPEVALREAGRSPERIVLSEPWTFDPERVPADTDMLVVGNPTNPTGVLHSRAALLALCRPGRITAVDEAFMDFVPDEPETLAAVRDAPGLIVIRSLTKLYGVPGLRIGYLLAAPTLARRLRAYRPGWSVNALALAAAVACMNNPDHAASVAREMAAARADLVERLEQIDGVEIHPSVANYVLLRIPDGEQVVAWLNARGIAVRPCHTHPGLTSDHIRIAVRDAGMHASFADALAEAIEATRARSQARAA